MKLTVVLLTYNHEPFIKRALDGVLLQETNFDYEVVISEDCSTDSTRDIIIDYRNRYPERIRLIISDKNIGNNEVLVRALKISRGQYIALLDGDDYWIYPQKLQRQVDFLDRNQDYAICFHEAYEIYQDGSKRLHSEASNWEPDGETFTLRDIAIQNFMATCSVVYRNGLFEKFPARYYTLPYGDWFLHVLNAKNGHIGYIPEVWSVRRVHSGGFMSGFVDVDILKMNIECLEAIDSHLGGECRSEIRGQIGRHHYEIVDLLCREGQVAAAKRHALACLRSAGGDERISRMLLLVFLISGEWFPLAYKRLRPLLSYSSELELRMRVADLAAKVEEFSAWGRRASEDVVQRDGVIRDLQARLAALQAQLENTRQATAEVRSSRARRLRRMYWGARERIRRTLGPRIAAP